MKTLKEMFVILNVVFFFLVLVSFPIGWMHGSFMLLKVVFSLDLLCNAIIVGAMGSELIIRKMK